MGSASQWLERRWYSEQAPPWLLRPFARLYGLGLQVRRRRLDVAPPLTVPVIVVGNITVGGTGKTPLVQAIVRHLQRSGRKPGVVLRGYRGRQREAVLLPEAAGAGDALQYGDEACLHRAQLAVPVAVGRDRAAAAGCLIKTGCDVIVSDDGLQHSRLPRHIEILVVDGERGFGNAALIPAGPLREPVARLDRVDLVVATGRTHPAATFVQQIRPLSVRRLVDGAVLTLADFAGTEVHAVAGIGVPERFFSMLRLHGIEPIEHAFPDHHPMRSEALDFGDQRPVLMTAKDAIKLIPDPAPTLHVVEVESTLDPGFFAALDRCLERADEATMAP